MRSHGSAAGMRLPRRSFGLGIALAASICGAAADFPGPARTGFQVLDDEPGPWPRILSSIGLSATNPGPRGVFVLRGGEAAAAAQWRERMAGGALLVLEGESELAAAFGFRPTARRVAVRSVADVHRPQLPVVWRKTLELPVWDVPPEAKVFARERWSGAPLVAGLSHGGGGLLWVAVTPGEQGYERFPYLLQALTGLGLEPPLRSSRLWAFFDSSYRLRVDLDYFAARWRDAGIGALHVAAWHFWERDSGRDGYLRSLIDACHRNAILVYAWFELPHVSQKFWDDHPEWREKTAVLQDAHLDWRRLMNLQNADCAAAIERGVAELIGRFDWDGVNLAELYFESLEGASNPARFTPFNAEVRREFRTLHGVDPVELFDPASPNHHAKRPEALRLFTGFRAALARRMQEEWMARLETMRRGKPHLDLVLTHVDDRFDASMREAIGADAAGLLPLAEKRDFTFLIEDPATIWHLGPKRYSEIADRYRPLAGRPEKLAIDINIVERYQEVYPTRQQTGAELCQLLHYAARSFPRVALYFENSILPPDLPLLASAAAAPERLERVDNRLVVNSRHGLGVPWKGDVRVNGRPWPVTDGRTVWLPPGPHTVEAAPAPAPMRVLRFNGGLRTASCEKDAVELSYHSPSRALAHVGRRPERLEVDGEAVRVEGIEGRSGFVLYLPRGQHVVSIFSTAE